MGEARLGQEVSRKISFEINLGVIFFGFKRNLSLLDICSPFFPGGEEANGAAAFRLSDFRLSDSNRGLPGKYWA